MSINATSLNADSTPILVNGEKLFQKQDRVKLEYESGSGYPGEGHNYFCESGIIYLTNIRIIYIPSPELPFLKSMNIPLENLENGKFIQPWFDANRYEGTVRPVPNGGLRLPGFVKFYFTNGGGFEFSSIYLQLRSRITGDAVLLPGDEYLPVYSPSSSTTSPVVGNSSSLSSRQTHVVPVPIPSDQPPSYE